MQPDLPDTGKHERQGREIRENIVMKEKIQKITAQKENRIPIKTNKNRLLNADTGHSGVPQESLTPRTRSKFEHLIRNLRESNDDEQLVLYKVMDCSPAPAPRVGNNLRITDVVPYKGEPKGLSVIILTNLLLLLISISFLQDKYSVEFLWNIGAANYVGSGNSRYKQKHRRRR